MKRVLVLMSTYNGEKYLCEQLDSLYNQTNVDIHILVRDDGSTDSTLDILKNYKTEKGNLDIIYGNNVGAGRSFFEVAHYAGNKFSNFDYYCFCDQDDIWLPEKLHRSVNLLDKIPKSNKLYIGRAQFVDNNLSPLGETSIIKYYDYTTSVYRNPALGCTMVFDKQLLEYFNKAYPHLNEIHNLHDAWMFKCANYLNSTIVNDNNICIYYRQHGNNVTTAKKNIIKRYFTALNRKFKRKGFHKNNSKVFLDIYQNYIIDNHKTNFLKVLITYDLSLSNTLKYLNLQPWKTECTFDKILWTLLVWMRLF